MKPQGTVWEMFKEGSMGYAHVVTMTAPTGQVYMAHRSWPFSRRGQRGCFCPGGPVQVAVAGARGRCSTEKNAVNPQIVSFILLRL